MDNVMNRPLFRRREARDRLNDMAGVQGYQVGGGVFADPSGSIRRPLSASSMIMPAQPVRPAGLPTALSFATGQENPELYARAASGMVSGAQTNLDVVRRQFSEARTPENYQRVLEAEEALRKAVQEAEALGPYVEELSAAPEPPPALRELPPGPFVDTKNPAFGEGPEQAVARMTPEQLDIFGRLDRAAEKAVPEQPAATVAAPPVPGQEQRFRPMPSGEAPPTFPSEMEREARESRPRGPLVTSPAEVAANLNAPDPVVRERTAKDFMQEFMANAPEYEGGDRNLMHAMIGFSIAAGDSPNAMTNIARGLQAGAQMFLQDKAAKDEFDRQLQLSAMQYGLQEATKERDRSRQPLTFVAIEDTTYRGRPVKRGEQIYIPYGEIERNGGLVPPGFGDTAMATAIAEREKGVFEALNKAYEAKLMDDTQVTTLRNEYSNAARNAVASQRGIDYMEAAILKVGEEGNITGLKGSLDTFISKVAAAAGAEDIAAEYGDRGQAVDAVKIAFQNLIPSALSGVQTANSISNRDIELLANAYVDSMLDNGVFSMSNITEEKLIRSMKGALDLLQTGRQQALTDLRGIEEQVSGRYLRSGDLTAPVPVSTVLEPFQALIPGEEQVTVPSQFGTLYRTEDGVYEIRMPGG